VAGGGVPAPDGGSPTPATGSNSAAVTVQPPPAPPTDVQPPASPPKTPTQTGREQKQEKTERRATSPEWTSKEVRRQAVPSIRRIEGSSSVTLMLGGLALLALVLCDTVFLTLSTREIRRVG
jgi:hypothetical protein